MPRASRKQAASTSTPKKREFQPSEETPTRASKRVKSSPATKTKTTPKKSQFFNHESSSGSEAEFAIQQEASGYEDEDASASSISTPAESEDDEDGDGNSSVEDAPRRRKPVIKTRETRTNGQAKTPTAVKGQELWRPGVKTGLEPGEAVFIKLPKARDAGSTPYKEDTVHPNTMAFLKDLKKNNDREWLKGKASGLAEAYL